MNLKKPKFWDFRKPNIYAYILLPISNILQSLKLFKNKSKTKLKIKTICVGNIYLGGTGKTSLSIKINKLLAQKNIKSCFIKKFYKDQLDEQKLLSTHGKLFSSHSRLEALKQAENENYEVAILDDGLQDESISHTLSFICFNNINWIGNGFTIPAGPLREKISILKNYNHVFLNGNLENSENLTDKLKQINPNIIIHLGKYEPINLEQFSINDKYIAFSGIGNHDTFISMIKNSGLSIIKEFQFPDHYSYSEKDINDILIEAQKFNCKIITTEKDFLRINNPNLTEIKFIKTDLKIIDEEKLLKTLTF